MSLRTGMAQLEQAVVGSTAILLSSKQPRDLEPGLQYLKAASRQVLLIGGKIGSYSWTNDGIINAMHQVPALESVQTTLVSALQHSSIELGRALQTAPITLANLLERQVDQLQQSIS